LRDRRGLSKPSAIAAARLVVDDDRPTPIGASCDEVDGAGQHVRLDGVVMVFVVLFDDVLRPDTARVRTDRVGPLDLGDFELLTVEPVAEYPHAALDVPGKLVARVGHVVPVGGAVDLARVAVVVFFEWLLLGRAQARGDDLMKTTAIPRGLAGKIRGGFASRVERARAGEKQRGA